MTLAAAPLLPAPAARTGRATLIVLAVWSCARAHARDMPEPHFGSLPMPPHWVAA